jgi:hypothetical protein
MSLFAPIALATVTTFLLAVIEKRKLRYVYSSLIVLILACFAAYVTGSNVVCYALKLFLKHGEEYKTLSATPYCYDTGKGSPEILTLVIYAEKPYSKGIKNVSLEVDASTIPIGLCKWDSTVCSFKPISK